MQGIQCQQQSLYYCPALPFWHRAARLPKHGHGAAFSGKQKHLHHTTQNQHTSHRCPRAIALHSVVTPHSGYHFDGSPRRFFEGWYWKVTIPENGQSFALIYSVEDPGNPGAQTAGVGIQVMGPNDGYICQFARDTSIFWGDRNSLALGAAMKLRPGVSRTQQPRGMLPPDDYNRVVEHGFQASAFRQQGAIIASENGTPGPALSTVQSASWDVTIQPVYGWGGPAINALGAGQRATAGWLSAVSVFEPHWQVLMAHGLASGWLEWGGQRYEFQSAPSYAEKNWGGGFPTKWHWIQCNTFDGQPNLSVTAVGARRALLLGVQSSEEDVGMICVHYNDRFIELVPWTSEVEWDVTPWGNWKITARGEGEPGVMYEAELTATCSAGAGTVLRAPTIQQGLAPFCKDTFFGSCRLQMWRLTGSGRREAFIDASTTTAALEVGGGPWWVPWKARAEMKEPFRSLVKLPIDLAAIGSALPQPLRPPGL